jgi:Gamma interferon inducible lysosomal thiol reductase (GILT)
MLFSLLPPGRCSSDSGGIETNTKRPLLFSLPRRRRGWAAPRIAAFFFFLLLLLLFLIDGSSRRDRWCEDDSSSRSRSSRWETTEGSYSGGDDRKVEEPSPPAGWLGPSWRHRHHHHNHHDLGAGAADSSERLGRNAKTAAAATASDLRTYSVSRVRSSRIHQEATTTTTTTEPTKGLLLQDLHRHSSEAADPQLVGEVDARDPVAEEDDSSSSPGLPPPPDNGHGPDGPSHSPAPRRVHLQVFVEALCVDSKRFVLEQLVPAYHLLTGNAVDLDLVVFGNAQIGNSDNDNNNNNKSSFGRGARPDLGRPVHQAPRDSRAQGGLTCQHGPAECDANSYEQCAVYVSKQIEQEQEQEHYEQELRRVHGDADDDNNKDPVKESLAYVACLFTDLDMGYRDAPFGAQVFTSCTRSAFADAAASFRIRACHDDPKLSRKLQEEAAKKTPKDHAHVPWILINGKHTYDPLDGADDDDDDDDDNSNAPAYRKLVKAICRAYHDDDESSGGSHRLPPACT